MLAWFCAQGEDAPTAPQLGADPGAVPPAAVIAAARAVLNPVVRTVEFELLRYTLDAILPLASRIDEAGVPNWLLRKAEFPRTSRCVKTGLPWLVQGEIAAAVQSTAYTVCTCEKMMTPLPPA